MIDVLLVLCFALEGVLHGDPVQESVEELPYSSLAHAARSLTDARERSMAEMHFPCRAGRFSCSAVTGVRRCVPPRRPQQAGIVS